MSRLDKTGYNTPNGGGIRDVCDLIFDADKTADRATIKMFEKYCDSRSSCRGCYLSYRSTSIQKVRRQLNE